MVCRQQMVAASLESFVWLWREGVTPWRLMRGAACLRCCISRAQE
jgi:hypothetical protein